MKRILILAAHPDDETLGCGGFMAKYAKSGFIFRVLILGEGSSCRFSTVDAEGVQNAIQSRQIAAKKAMNVLGVHEIIFGNLSCGRFDQVAILEINKRIEQQIALFKPDIIFTHSQFDVNNDHRIIARATEMATRPNGMNRVPYVYSYEVLSSSECSFNEVFKPNMFEVLDQESIELKWKALSQYETEVREYPFVRSEKGIFAQAMNRGMQTGSEFAEAFTLIRGINQ